MAALDFPSSPTNGQVFGNWVYNLSKQAWQSKPLTPAKTTNSPTAPTSPADGDQWFNTNNGSLYIYYTDANSSQWVESRAPVTADGYISPNYIHNSGFEVNQRGFTSAPAGGVAYCSDRWVASGMSSANIQNVGTSELNGTGLTNFLRMSRTSNVGNYPAIEQHVEDVRTLAGSTVTLSFYARQNTAWNAGTWYVGWYQSFGSGGSTGTGNLTVQAFPSLSSSWQRYSFTFSIDSIAGKTVGPGSYLNIIIRNNGNTQTAGETDITGIQLETGNTVTPYRRNGNSLAQEIYTCKRYYQRYTNSNNDYPAWIVQISPTGVGAGTSAGYGMYPFPVTMRTAPTITFNSASNFTCHVPGVLINSSTGLSATNITVNTAQFNVSGNSSFTFGQMVNLQWTGSLGVFELSADI